jgi:hypothetical protein
MLRLKRADQKNFAEKTPAAAAPWKVSFQPTASRRRRMKVKHEMAGETEPSLRSQTFPPMIKATPQRIFFQPPTLKALQRLYGIPF